MNHSGPTERGGSMTNEQIIVLVVALLLFACPFLLAFFIYKFLRMKRQRNDALNSLEVQRR
jgi:hypothetical protein